MRLFATILVLSLSVFVVVPSAAAQGRIYKWVDAQGRVHYSDTPIGRAESVDDALPPASTFGTPPQSTVPDLAPPAPESDASPPAPSAAVSPPTEPEAVPPIASPPSDEPQVSEPFTGDDALPTGDDAPEQTTREDIAPTAGEEENSAAAPTQDSTESFNSTQFDSFVPGGLEGGEAPDAGSLATEGMEEGAEELGEEEEAE